MLICIHPDGSVTQLSGQQAAAELSAGFKV
jgi:hypothetical protein